MFRTYKGHDESSACAWSTGKLTNSYNLLGLRRCLRYGLFPLQLIRNGLFCALRSSRLGDEGVKVPGHDKSNDDDAQT